MAYTNIATQAVTKSGITLTYDAAVLVDGNMFTNTGAEIIHVKNGGGGAVTVTVVTPAVISGLDIEDRAVVVNAGGDSYIGTFEPGLYNQGAGDVDTGKTYIEYDQVAGVTVAVIQP